MRRPDHRHGSEQTAPCESSVQRVPADCADAIAQRSLRHAIATASYAQSALTPHAYGTLHRYCDALTGTPIVVPGISIERALPSNCCAHRPLIASGDVF